MAHYILDHIHDTAEKIRLPNLLVHWAPGHSDFPPNKRADELAKEAAKGFTSPLRDLPPFLRKAPLPTSLTALRQSNLTHIKAKWKTRWKHTPDTHMLIV